MRNCASGESRDSGFDAEPVIGPCFARTRWHRPGMTESGSLRCVPNVRDDHDAPLSVSNVQTTVAMTSKQAMEAFSGAAAVAKSFKSAGK